LVQRSKAATKLSNSQINGKSNREISMTSDFPDLLIELRRIRLALVALMTKQQYLSYQDMLVNDGLPPDVPSDQGLP
jgi:hypothetical protein